MSGYLVVVSAYVSANAYYCKYLNDTMVHGKEEIMMKARRSEPVEKKPTAIAYKYATVANPGLLQVEPAAVH